jgi:hypothetical protein
VQEDGVATVQAQFLDMIVDGQGDDGAVSDITPTVWQLGAMQPSDASWGSAFPTMAYQVCEDDNESFMFWFEPVLANDRLVRACLGKRSFVRSLSWQTIDVFSIKKTASQKRRFVHTTMAYPPTHLRKTAFLSHLYIKTISLPRQARDKHRETTQKKDAVFLRTPNHLGMDDNRLHSSD